VQAADAASKLQAAQQETIARTNEVARLAAETARNQTAKLDQIHTLVNSDMTAARQSELDQHKAMLVVLQRVVSMAYAKGTDPDPADVQAIEQTRRRIDELEAILADRLIQFRQAEADIALKAPETEA
jgi:hypothetical protein